MNGRRRPRQPATAGDPEAQGPAIGNSFGLLEAMLGIVVGFVLTYLAVAVYAELTHHPRNPSQYGEDIVSLLALWVGFVGAVVLVSRSARREAPERDSPERRAGGSNGAHGTVPVGTVPVGTGSHGTGPRGTGSVVRDFGIKLRPWPDLPLGIAAGVASQYLLVPVAEAPLAPFVHHLYTRLSHPAQTLTGHAFGPGLVVLAVLVCVGSPVVEELFFRGLLLRALLGVFGELGPRLGPAASIVVTALVFALVHFEALQFLGLAAFGVVLGVLAWRTGRLGPSIVAHMAFNTVTIVAIVVSR